MQEDRGGRLDVDEEGVGGVSSADAVSGERVTADAAISCSMTVLRVGVVSSLNCLGAADKVDERRQLSRCVFVFAGLKAMDGSASIAKESNRRATFTTIIVE